MAFCMHRPSRAFSRLSGVRAAEQQVQSEIEHISKRRHHVSGSCLKPCTCRNLPLSTQDGDLGSMFAPYGSVLEKRILPLVDGAMGAGALVRMGSTEEATAAIGGLHNQTPMGATLPLLLRYADTPEEKARKAAKRDRSGAFVPQNQPAQGPFSPAARMQQPYQSTPGQMQQGYPSNPTGHQMQSPMGSYPSGGYPQAQQMQAPMDGYAAPGGYSSAQPGYQQQQQPQQQPQQMPQQQPMAGGQSQTAGYYPGPQQGGMQGYPNQPAAAPAFSGVADAGGIPGLGGPKQPQNDFSAYSAQGTPGPTGMNGQFSGHGAASATGTPGGPGGQPPYMPAANAAGPASTPGMNGNFMQMPGPAPGGGPFMQGGMQQGFGPQGGGLPPGGPPMMGGPSMGGPGFGPPGGMGVPMQPMGGPMGMPMQPQGYTPSSLYVKNLPPEADKLFLYEKFAPFGAIQGLKLLTHDTGKCKGVAFVNFSSNQAASEAIAALHQTKVGERVLHVSLQLFRGQRG